LTTSKIDDLKLKVLRNDLIAKDTYLMELQASINVKPGMFVNIKLSNHYLRRPISISLVHDHSFEIIYKVKGQGTKDLSSILAGDYLDVLLPLGNGYDLVENKKVLLVGGGIGIPPLLELKKQLDTNNQVTLMCGFNSIEEHAYQDYSPLVCTIQESDQFVGNVVEYIKDLESKKQLDYDYIYACGPMPMLRALQDYIKVDGQISIEERMGCGFGACMGCTCKTKANESKRICLDGPVFKLGEIDLYEY